jgi:hypothetical protein
MSVDRATASNPQKVAFPDSSQSTMRRIPFFVESERNTRNGVVVVPALQKRGLQARAYIYI